MNIASAGGGRGGLNSFEFSNCARTAMIVLRLPDCWSRTEGMVRIGRIGFLPRESCCCCCCCLCVCVYISLPVCAGCEKKGSFNFIFFLISRNEEREFKVFFNSFFCRAGRLSLLLCFAVAFFSSSSSSFLKIELKFFGGGRKKDFG